MNTAACPSSITCRLTCKLYHVLLLPIATLLNNADNRFPLPTYYSFLALYSLTELRSSSGSPPIALCQAGSIFFCVEGGNVSLCNATIRALKRHEIGHVLTLRFK